MKVPKNLSSYMSEMGRKGGKVGGPARAAKLSAKRRLEIARDAAAKRWVIREGCPDCGTRLCPHGTCENYCHDEVCGPCMDEASWHNVAVAEENARNRMWDLVGGFPCLEEISDGVRCNLALGHEGEHQAQ